jgi:MSHA pilin protein MshC
MCKKMHVATQIQRSAKPRAMGFTLVELITVMVLLGIVGALATARFFGRESYESSTYAEQITSMLRYGQKLAIAQNRPVYVRLNATGVALCFNSITCGLSTDQVLHPAGSNSASTSTKAACANNTQWFCEGLPTGITVSWTPSSLTGFYFDPLGKPFNLSDAYPSSVSTFANLPISVNSSASTSIAIVVEQESGYVH